MILNLALTLAFLFFAGSVIGWGAEVLFRRFFSSSNPERKWINPGFCVGPYLPLYGCGLCALFLIAILAERSALADSAWSKVVPVLAMAVCMTGIEYIAGILSLKVFQVRLWDYRKEWGNIQGIICPKFSLAWAVVGAVYYFWIHPYVLNSLAWLSHNLAFSFFIGLFYGIFIIDMIYSSKLLTHIKQYAEKNDVVVRYEHLKAYVRKRQDELRQKHHFFFPLHSETSLSDYLREIKERLETRTKKKK